MAATNAPYSCHATRPVDRTGSISTRSGATNTTRHLEFGTGPDA
jgi:hypothetical protein